jgi:hypothetical protein
MAWSAPEGPLETDQRIILYLETRLPRAFQFTKRAAIKLITRYITHIAKLFTL